MDPQKNYYVTIPAVIVYSKELNCRQKILIGMISNMSNIKGYCWATNAHFAEALDCDERTIRNDLAVLEKIIGLNRIMQLDQEGKEYFRILVLPDNFSINKKEDKIENIGAGSTRPGDRITASGGDRIVASGIITKNKKQNKKTLSSSFTDPENQSALQELEILNQWTILNSIWVTNENSSVLKNSYKKYFIKLDDKRRNILIDYLKSLGEDKSYLTNIWISTFLKDGCDMESLKKDVQKIKSLRTPQTPQANYLKIDKNMKY